MAHLHQVDTGEARRLKLKQFMRQNLASSVAGMSAQSAPCHTWSMCCRGGMQAALMLGIAGASNARMELTDADRASNRITRSRCNTCVKTVAAAEASDLVSAQHFTVGHSAVGHSDETCELCGSADCSKCTSVLSSSSKAHRRTQHQRHVCVKVDDLHRSLAEDCMPSTFMRFVHLRCMHSVLLEGIRKALPCSTYSTQGTKY